MDILQNFQPISEAKAKPIQITPETGADLSLNDKGEVDLDEGYVIGKAADVFGAKLYESNPALDTALQEMCIRDRYYTRQMEIRSPSRFYLPFRH